MQAAAHGQAGSISIGWASVTCDVVCREILVVYVLHHFDLELFHPLRYHGGESQLFLSHLTYPQQGS